MPLTFYARHILQLNNQLYPKTYITQQLIQAKQFIDTHYATALSLDAIARQAHFSRFHFLRQFRTLYGTTPNQYLAGIRINKAKQLLRDGVAVNEACFAVGFTSITSFTSLFKKITGSTPGQYKRKAILKKAVS